MEVSEAFIQISSEKCHSKQETGMFSLGSPKVLSW